ncbi:MAG: hypothetical protein WCN81_09160 [Actinomycetes bacterium]
MEDVLEESKAPHELDALLRRLALGRAADRVADYGRGRVCEHPGCVTRLSIYNPEPCCALHDIKSRPHARRGAARR